MPTYAYTCRTCGNSLEVKQSFTDAALTQCPTCGGLLRKVFNSVGVVFKGSGFYRNDSRTGDAAGKGGKESKDSGSSESSSSESGETKKDSTTAAAKAGKGAKEGKDSGSSAGTSSGSSTSGASSPATTSKAAGS